MKTLLLLICLTLSCFGQTKANLLDLKPPVSPTINLIAYVTLPNSNGVNVSSIVSVVLGPGLVIDPPGTAGGAWTLRAINPAAAPQIFNVEQFTASGTPGESFTLTATPKTTNVVGVVMSGAFLQVSKAGLVMQKDVDYTLTQNVVTFLPNQTARQGDFITVRYQ